MGGDACDAGDHDDPDDSAANGGNDDGWGGAPCRVHLASISNGIPQCIEAARAVLQRVWGGGGDTCDAGDPDDPGDSAADGANDDGWGGAPCGVDLVNMSNRIP